MGEGSRQPSHEKKLRRSGVSHYHYLFASRTSRTSMTVLTFTSGACDHTFIYLTRLYAASSEDSSSITIRPTRSSVTWTSNLGIL